MPKSKAKQYEILDRSKAVKIFNAYLRWLFNCISAYREIDPIMLTSVYDSLDEKDSLELLDTYKWLETPPRKYTPTQKIIDWMTNYLKIDKGRFNNVMSQMKSDKPIHLRTITNEKKLLMGCGKLQNGDVYGNYKGHTHTNEYTVDFNLFMNPDAVAFFGTHPLKLPAHNFTTIATELAMTEFTPELKAEIIRLLAKGRTLNDVKVSVAYLDPELLGEAIEWLAKKHGYKSIVGFLNGESSHDFSELMTKLSSQGNVDALLKRNVYGQITSTAWYDKAE